MKEQIIKAQKLELDASIIQLQKTTIHYSLLLSNHLVRFYKTLYGKSLFASSPHSSNEKILAQDAVRAIISGDLNHFNFDDTDISQDAPDIDNESDSEDTPKYVNKNNNNYCKLLQFIGVESKQEIINTFSEFIYGADRKSANISHRDDVTTHPDEASISIVTNNENSITIVTDNDTPVSIVQTTIATETEIWNLTNEINDIDGLQSSESSELSTSSTSSSEFLIPNNPPNPLNPPNPPNPSLLPPKYTMQDNKILEGVMPILFKLIPLLTVSVFERYEETAQFKLAEAECAAMYENTKRSQMCNEVNKILDNKQSVKGTIIKSIISDEVQSELSKMRNKVKNSQHKIDEANKKLTSLKSSNNSSNNSSKDRAVSKFVKTAANTELNQNLNINPKKKEKNRKCNPRHHEIPLNSTSIPTPKKTILNSKSNSNSNEKEINKVLSSPRDIVQERKEKKTKRNIRQRENRKRRKVASLVDHNSVSDTTEERK